MLYIIYGTQTGNSEEIAKLIKERTKKDLNVDSEIYVMNKFAAILPKLIELNKHMIVVMVCSTTGSGDIPATADNFVRFLRKKTNQLDMFKNIHYTMLGLGDSNYSKYQYVPRLIDELFGKLSANKFYQRGEADDAYGLENFVEPWINQLIPKIKEQLELLDSLSKKENQDGEEDENEGEINLKEFDLENFKGKVISNVRLTGRRAENESKMLLFEVNNRSLTHYESGATVDIIPETKMLTLEGVNQKIKIANDLSEQDEKIKNVLMDLFEKYPHFKIFYSQSKPLTEEIILKYIIDFNSTLKLSDFDKIKELFKTKTEDEEYINKLEVLSKNYKELIQNNKINLFDIIMTLEETILLTLSEIILYFPKKITRSYSLCTSSLLEHDQLGIIYSVKEDRFTRRLPKDHQLHNLKPGNLIFEGECTHFLKKLRKDDKLIITAVRNNFKFPLNAIFNEDPSPLIYICNGTGITPFVSFLKSIIAMKSTFSAKNKLGKICVFTGFRTAEGEKKDTILEAEILSYIKEINEITGKETISYFRCLSQANGKYFVYFF